MLACSALSAFFAAVCFYLCLYQLNACVDLMMFNPVRGLAATPCRQCDRTGGGGRQLEASVASAASGPPEKLEDALSPRLASLLAEALCRRPQHSQT